MSLETLSISDIVSKYGKNDKDTGSTEVQVAILSKKINHLSKHLSQYKKDHDNRKTLLALVGKRRKLLRYLQNNNLEGYRALIKNLELRH